MKLLLSISSDYETTLRQVAEKYFSERSVNFAFNQNTMSRETVIGLTEKQFRKLAEPGYSRDKLIKVLDVLDSGSKLSDLPFLGVDVQTDGNVIVANNGKYHEGRHRAIALDMKGVKLIPVIVKCREGGEGPVYRWGSTTKRPEFISGYNGYKIPFPKTIPY